MIAVLALVGAAPLRAVTIESPVRQLLPRGLAPERASATGERFLELRPASLEKLRGVPAGEALRLEQFPLAPDVTGDLVLERFEVTTADARVIVHGDAGETSLPLARGVHFRGMLDGDPESRVYVGVPGAFVVAVIRTGAGLVYVGPNGPAEGPVQHVVRRADSARNAELGPLEWHCDVEELPLAPKDVPRGDGGGSPITLSSASALSPLEASATTALKEAAISIETDQEMLAKFSGNVSNMSAYVTTLLAQASLIYQRDVGVALTINRLQAWTGTDPYVTGDPRGQLDEVGDWWHGNRPKSSYPRAAVLFLSGKTVSGGIAWLDVLCSSDFGQGGHWGGAYAVVQAFGNYPANLWDLLASTHELGHNFGSPHTHCFSPPIDKCWGSEAGCYSGPTVNPGPLGGTIMSYCHLLAGGYANIDMRFHERCISEEMLPEINSVSCLTTIPDGPPVVSSFYTIPPCRVVDTRNPTGSYGGPALAANSQRSFTLAGQCGIPSGAKAVSLNVTVTQGTAAGVLKLFPAGSGIPTATSINYRSNQTRANNSLSGLGSGGALTVRCEQNGGSVQAIIDVNGYFQ